MRDLVYLNLKRKVRAARRLPRLHGLRCFEAVGRLGSIKAAAAELHVTPAAVSQAVKLLEADVGVALLETRGNSVALTEMAAHAHEPLSAAFRLMQVAVNRMYLKPRQVQLRLTCEPALAANWLIARLPAYRALEGAVPIALDPSKAVVDLVGREADVAIRFGRGDYPGLTAIRLFEDETIFPVCAPCLIHRGRGLNAPKDLAGHTLLRLDWKSRLGLWPDWSAWLLAAGLGELAMQLDEMIEDEDDAAVAGGDAAGGDAARSGAAGAKPTDGKKGQRRPKRFRSIGFADSSLLLKAAIEGQGVALGQSSLVKDLIKQGQLVAPFAQSPAQALKTGFSYYLVYPPELEDRKDLAVFRDWLVREAKGE